MKKIFTYLIVVLAFSCSVTEDETIRSILEILPIESASMPQFLEFGQTYEINLSYIKQSNCHTFNDIYYQKDGNERTIAIITSVYPGTNCLTSYDEVETSFDFIVNDTGSYIFKFWQGKDINGNDLYLTMEVPVE